MRRITELGRYGLEGGVVDGWVWVGDPVVTCWAWVPDPVATCGVWVPNPEVPDPDVAAEPRTLDDGDAAADAFPESVGAV